MLDSPWQKLSRPGKPIGLTYLCIELSLEINFSLRIYLKNQFVIPLVCVKNLGWSQYTILRPGGTKRAVGQLLLQILASLKAMPISSNDI